MPIKIDLKRAKRSQELPFQPPPPKDYSGLAQVYSGVMPGQDPRQQAELEAAAKRAVEQQALLREKRLKEAAAKKKDSPGFLGRLKGIGAAFIDVLDKPIEELVRQPIYSAERAKTLGASNLQGIQAGIAGLPGLGFVAGKSEPIVKPAPGSPAALDPTLKLGTQWNKNILRQAVEDTNTRKERAILTDQGQLESTGQVIAGQTKFPKPIPLIGGKRVSGAVDLGVELVLDPLNILGVAATDFAKVGEKAGARGVRVAEKAGVRLDNLPAVVAAERQGRAVFLESTQGRKILDAATEAAKESRDPAALSKAVKGLTATDAKKVLEVAQTGTTGEVRNAIARTFIEATWNPHVPVLRQATHLGVGRAAAPKGLGLTRWADNLVRGDGAGFATGTSKEAGATLARTAQRAGMAAGKFAGDLRPTETLGMGITERVDRLRGLVDNSDNAAFQDVVSEELGRVLASGTNAEADRLLARMEVVEAALSGQAGDAARIQAQAELSQGFLLSKKADDPITQLHQAVELRGLSLPKAGPMKATEKNVAKLAKRIEDLGDDEWQAILNKHLDEAVKTKAGLGKVSRDITLATDSFKLEAEAVLKAERSAIRAEKKAARLNKPTPAWEGGPALFHGSSRALPEGGLGDRWSFGRSAQNLFGPGFYTTDLEDVAKTYTGKGTGVDRIVYGVRWLGGDAPKLVDLDAPAEQLLRSRAARAGEEFEAGAFDVVQEDYDAFLAAVADPNATSADIIRAYRKTLASTGEVHMADADDMVGALTEVFEEAGYDGLTHVGGRYAAKAGSPEHQVHIFFDPTKLSAAERKLVDVAATGPRMPVHAGLGTALRTDAEKALARVDARIAQLGAPEVVKPGLGQRVSKGAARRILDAQESIAPKSIPFTASRHAGLATTLRVEGVDRWAKAVDLDRTARAALREAVTAAQTEEEVFAAIENGLTLLAARNGVDPDDLVTLYRAARSEGAGPLKVGRGTGIDEGGKLVRDHEFVAAQRVHDLKLPDVADIKKSIKILKQGGDTDLALALAEAKSGLGTSGLIRLLKKGHHVWKFQIVSNAYAPVIGGVGGFAFGGGSLEERAKRGLIGAAIGLFGPLRYVVRVGLIEERILRYSLARPGVKTLPEYIPFLARHWAERGVTIPFVDEHLVTAQGRLDSIVGTKLSTLGEDWVAMGQKDPRFLEGWSRIVNYQIHPESDEVSRIFLNVKAGTMTLDEGIAAATDFLKNTVDGQILRKRLAGGIGGTSKIDEILARYQHFIDSNTTPKIAQTRLDAANHGVQVDKAVLKGELKAGLGPQKVHAQKTWVIPKNYTQVKATANKLLKDLVFEGPTSATRTAMARAEYGDEFRRLVRAGVPEEEAAANASEFAVRRTNEVMFQISDESRMAKKLDYIAPFQQPREELLRVWGKMIKNNPFQAMKMTREGALIFNNGKDSGMFREDAFGNYVMSVPGSGQLSQALTGVNSNMDFNLKDTLFFTQGAFGQELGVGVNFLPVPGGPWWTIATKAWATTNPDAYKDMPDGVKGLLFPYGVSGALTSGPGRRLWQYATGTIPPWEFASQQDQQDSHNRMMLEMAAQLRYQHMQNTGDPNYIPSEEEVEKALRSYYGFWAFMGSVSPAAPQPVFPGQKEFEAVQNAYRDPAKGFYPDGQARVDWTKLVDENPVMDFYLQKSTNGNKYVGPDDFKHWTEQDEDKSEQYQLHLRERLDYDTFTDQFKQHQKDSLAWTEWKNILNTPSSLQNTYVKEALLVDWRARNPHLAQGSMTSYVRDAELADILRYPQSVQNVRIDDWRKTHNVSHKQFVAIKADIDKNGFKEEPWRRARYSEDVFRDVAKQITLGGQEETIVSTLLPAEQINYWKFKISQLSYYNGSPQDPIEQERQKDLYQKYNRELYKAHPELRGDGKDLSAWEKALEGYKGPIREQIDASYDEINRINPVLQELAQTNQWTAYYQLRDKKTALYDQINVLKNKMYETIPNVPEWQQDIAAVMLHNGDFKGLFDLPGIRTEYGIDFVPSDEEASYLGLPIGLQRNTVEQLRLMLTQGDARIGDNGAYISKLEWSFLTDFQKDLLERNLPADLISDLKGGVYAAATGGSSGGGGGGYSKGGGGGSGNAELDYAYELFAQYNRRPEGAKAPAAYADYLALPANPALRADFIKKNPDVAEWIKLGPMSNMNDIERYIVSNIMIKYGKWEGEEKSMTEITDLAFAREQLKRFNMRGTSTRPEAYDNWLNMPSGIEKALYIKQHPEIGDWIRLGPMANMPEEYQTVVRDIMMRYGEWSNQQDALGDTIAEYYKIPAFAREQYLEDHPELVEYWRAIRTPEEQRKFAMADQYFSIQDNRAKRAYLMSNPELQQFFLDQRTKRYEKFLNQVAQFMGQNPEMFEGYLTRQSDILAEMYRRYSSPSLMNEVHVVKSQSTGTKRTAPKQRTRAA